MSVSRVIVPGELVCDYAERKPENPSRVILVLHGYSLSGPWMHRKLEDSLPQDAWILSPSGPFPIPEKKNGKYRMGYSWYFYDPYQDEYFIDMRVAVTYLEAFLKSVGALSLPITIVGYSQGGYLAPFVAERLSSVTRVERVIGIACQFLEKEFRAPIVSNGVAVRMDAIHGEEDESVSFELARAAHEALMKSGVPGEFKALPGVGHRIGPEIQEALAGLW